MFGIEPLQPAYGRQYNSLAAVQKDFDADKDFMTPMGQYINKSQIQAKRIQVRYGKNLVKTGFLTLMILLFVGCEHQKTTVYYDDETGLETIEGYPLTRPPEEGGPTRGPEDGVWVPPELLENG